MLLYKGTPYDSIEELDNEMKRPFREGTPLFCAPNFPLDLSFLPGCDAMSITKPVRWQSVRTILRSLVTEVLFPTDVSSEAEQVNELNYNSFVRIMAEMMQKYASKILNTKEDRP